ncbi:hypothetical protein KUL25_13065 [Rhodobacteraceae bacterium N5(2021)]|uniref:Uncharacterized protein n=1 Tax=Gymnodinialimonas phycosphaerae TaxID=2841589 RepID=A0A975TRX7_9RHOB|nr:hypothetical protein [Gymnodinialimonas phycosphaerae]MBY4893695.1 hypothetical protein [Gymnodinialimonas phycosphaerae]
MLRNLLFCFAGALGLSASSAFAELSIDGPCSQGHRWTATLINQGGGGIASYNTCTPEFDMVYLRCTPGSPAVDITIENAFPGLGPQERLTANVVVDGSAFPVSGTVVYSEMTGSGHPVFTLDQADPLFAALGQESRASVSLAGTTFAMHLSGSSDILSAMFEGCQ